MWSKTRKAMYERLAPALKDRVEYDFKYIRPRQRTEPPANPKCHCEFCSFHRYFAIKVDKEQIMISNNQIYYERNFPITMEKKEARGLFEIADVAEAMHQYLNVNSIEECLSKENYLLYLFAILDRRVGKRRIRVIYEQMEQEPEWIRRFIKLRAEAEKII